MITEALSAGEMRVLGVPVSLVNMRSAVGRVLSWGISGGPKTVFVRDVHGLMRALENPALLDLHERASLVVPDGMPLTWVGRLRGYGTRIGRTPGADLMEEICRESVREQLGHYFFGGLPGIADKMADRLSARYPGLRIVGTYSPPFKSYDTMKSFGEDELREIEAIRQVRPDYIWVGLPSPKQEFWMMKAAPRFPHGVFLGVGAAFDFHSGAVARAPAVLRNNGFEWLHRLLTEPRRLWRRYLVLAPIFVVKVAIEQVTGSWKHS